MIRRVRSKTLVALASVAMLLVFGGDALGGLFGTPIDNASFEDPVTATSDTNVTDWFEPQENNASFLGGYVIDVGAGSIPATPHGNQWLELISNANTPGAVYQQIGTWDPNVTYTFSSLIGDRTAVCCGDADYQVQLWAGGTSGSAANNTSLTALGATAIDTTGPINLIGGGATENRSFDLSSGSGHTVGDALWLQLSQVAPNGSLANNSVTLFDNVSVAVNATPPASVIENGSFETPVITTGNNLTRVDGWFEEAEGSTLGGFVVNLSGESGSPAAPDGNQWLELLSDPNTPASVYQQVGTFNPVLFTLLTCEIENIA